MIDAYRSFPSGLRLSRLLSRASQPRSNLCAYSEKEKGGERLLTPSESTRPGLAKLEYANGW